MKISFVLGTTRLFYFENDAHRVHRPIPNVDDIFVYAGRAYVIEARVFDYPEDEVRLRLRREKGYER